MCKVEIDGLNSPRVDQSPKVAAMRACAAWVSGPFQPLQHTPAGGVYSFVVSKEAGLPYAPLCSAALVSLGTNLTALSLSDFWHSYIHAGAPQL